MTGYAQFALGRSERARAHLFLPAVEAQDEERESNDCTA